MQFSLSQDISQKNKIYTCQYLYRYGYSGWHFPDFFATIYSSLNLKCHAISAIKRTKIVLALFEIAIFMRNAMLSRFVGNKEVAVPLMKIFLFHHKKLPLMHTQAFQRNCQSTKQVFYLFTCIHGEEVSWYKKEERNRKSVEKISFQCSISIILCGL